MASVSQAGLTSDGGLVAAVLSDLVLEQLYDPTDLSALMTFVPFGSEGSGSMDVTQDAVPGAFAARTDETTGGISDSTYGTEKFTLSPVGYSRKYSMTDLVPISGGPIQIDRVAANLTAGVALTLTDLLCALFPAVASTATPGSGDALDVSTMYDAQFALNSQSVGGPFAAVLSPKQINNFQASLRAEAGAVQFVPATADLLGCMFGAGAFAYTLANAQLAAGLVPPGLLYMANSAMVIEMSRDQSNFVTSLIASIFPAVVEAEDLRACQIISDE